jgi:hypothetical protein
MLVYLVYHKQETSPSRSSEDYTFLFASYFLNYHYKFTVLFLDDDFTVLTNLVLHSHRLSNEEMTNADKASIDIAPSASLLACCRSLARADQKSFRGRLRENVLTLPRRRL